NTSTNGCQFILAGDVGGLEGQRPSSFGSLAAVRAATPPVLRPANQETWGRKASPNLSLRSVPRGKLALADHPLLNRWPVSRRRLADPALVHRLRCQLVAR